MEINKIEEYLDLLDDDSFEEFVEIFDKFYEDVEFYGEDSEIYNFPEDYKRVLRAMQEFGIISVVYDELIDDDLYSTSCSQLDMAKVKNLINEINEF